ncbi:MULTISPECIES: lipoprotein-releasing ABC transporter ATP-binding protein LolD [unclassified Shewanella]|uniref:lipoprotein-releasing ABC transporter ATP-binding protein LolD n=1 Tax=unclassified Shewanella TaxID=196818 RepID=UPI000C828B17|nr:MULTISPECIES: lipoprotein-releasing ABC transporter ATP-binding protein LolD [unclassified Shewanella]MDO6620652.1 lipoprotein-releasing ABC transporter ATP-binding protein LolD [Shewanella sp. 6_MG-2023]MDO6641684.1 lipoprotein-releasing ABC transporter ATP-binding protein LolD [Shewanella sp. 5_MG-2023]MDO6677931.1 lipoprotein-releasing ABC transporter ATP-binding protein LolD [Shewanella sp. 4_MG-2023]MDO6777053.1 lipoprotein-releasing ABC transporter ATP-binding protein LolD [Shewanella 
MNKQPVVLEVNKVTKQFHDGETTTKVLSSVDLTVYQGEQLAIVGTSGSGKSTLLHIMGTLDIPTSGTVKLDGEDLYQLSAARQAEVRNKDLGFIYQFHHLLPEFSALENVAMPAFIQGRDKKQSLAEATALLERVGLGHRLEHIPAQLSGGERQRVAIARALINKPKLVLADEPTGNLDASSGDSVYELIRELAQQLGTAFVVVTHDYKLAAKMDRQLTMKDGVLQQVAEEK